MEKVELYENLVFELPPVPAKHLIAGHDLPIKKQKWIRPELPKNFDFLAPEEQEKIAFEEDRRCSEGLWFYNKGIPTYITGDNYFYLTHFKIDVGYPEYRDVDRRWFYAWELCDKNNDCLGLIYLKKRRDGFSYRAVSIILNRARKIFNSHYGMVSKTGDDAKELFAKVVYAFRELPEIFKPQVQTAEDVKKELYFSEPVKKVSHKNRKIKKGISLNTKISWRNTVENAYDSMKLKIALGDEVAKWVSADFEKWSDVVGTCLKLGNINIIGKSIFGSTVNEPQKATEIQKRVGAKAFENKWKKSSTKEKINMGRTVSELWRYLVPAFDGLEGFIGEYGESVIENPTEEQKEYLSNKAGKRIEIGSKQYLDGVRKALKDSGNLAGYYEFCRQFPYNEIEAFRESTDKDSVFDLSRLYQQIEYNDTLPLSTVIKGNFVWVERPKKAKFVENPDGRWSLILRLKDDEANRIIYKNGLQSPGNINMVSGCDPFDHDLVKDYRRSSGASHVYMKYHLSNSDYNNTFISEYHARPQKSALFYEDIMMQSVYFGTPLLCESQKVGLINHFKNNGLVNYLMWKPDVLHTEWTKKNTVDVGASLAGLETREIVVGLINAYIVDNVGWMEEAKRFGKLYFNALLQELIDFDVHKWTPFDRVVSMGLALSAAERKAAPKPDEDKAIQYFREFTTRGNKSVLVKK